MEDGILHPDIRKLMERYSYPEFPLIKQHVVNFELTDERIHSHTLVLNIPHQTLCGVRIDFDPNWNGIPVTLVSRRMRYSLRFSRNQDLSYSFSDTWWKVVQSEDFEDDAMIQLWSFLDGNNQLCFAICDLEGSGSS